ncbi:hypothetical protein PYCC9005_005319 [Savitreella phatthalungensis]
MMRPLIPTLRLSQSSTTTTTTFSPKRPYSLLRTSIRPQVPPTARLPLSPLSRSLWIQTEQTPNSDALKFVPAGTTILPSSYTGGTIEYVNGREASGSPLARKLFSVDGVSTVFYGRDFVTVTKRADAAWPSIKTEVFGILMEHLSAGEPVLVDVNTGAAPDTAAAEGDDEVVGMIKELLDTRIRPSIQEDGGDIEYRGFEDGVVKVKLRGACRTCDSSTVTLKNGIESMLMHYVPEVEAVEQVLDPEEQMAEQTFAEFEASLKAKRHTNGDTQV